MSRCTARITFNALSTMIDEAHAHNLKILITVNSVPTWAYTPFSGQPADPALFANFIDHLTIPLPGSGRRLAALERAESLV